MFRNFLVNLIKFDKDGGSSGTGSGQNDGGSQGDSKSKKDGEANSGANGSGSSNSANGGADGDGEGEGQLDVTKLDPKVQKLIADLRKENGDHRKKNKNLSESHDKLKKSLIEAGIIEDDSEPAEEKLKSISQNNEQLSMKSAILEAAVEHGVGKEDLKYFSFLIQEAVGALQDDEELDEDKIAEIAKQSKRNTQQRATTSVDTSKGGTQQKPGASSDVTVEHFAKMNMGEKTAIYVKDKDLYNRLMSEAKDKNLLISAR